MDKDTNYYTELKNYFKLGLDFLDPNNDNNKLEITDYYADGTINKYYRNSWNELIS